MTSKSASRITRFATMSALALFAMTTQAGAFNPWTDVASRAWVSAWTDGLAAILSLVGL